jgi:hypothetical protein
MNSPLYLKFVSRKELLREKLLILCSISLEKNVPVRGEIIFPRAREENLMFLIALLIRTIKFCHETRDYQSNYLL